MCRSCQPTPPGRMLCISSSESAAAEMMVEAEARLTQQDHVESDEILNIMVQDLMR